MQIKILKYFSLNLRDFNLFVTMRAILSHISNRIYKSFEEEKKTINWKVHLFFFVVVAREMHLFEAGSGFWYCPWTTFGSIENVSMVIYRSWIVSHCFWASINLLSCPKNCIENCAIPNKETMVETCLNVETLRSINFYRRTFFLDYFSSRQFIFVYLCLAVNYKKTSLQETHLLIAMCQVTR